MPGFTGTVCYEMQEPVFADAEDEIDAEFKMKEAFKEDFPEAIWVEIRNIEEVKSKRV